MSQIRLCTIVDNTRPQGHLLAQAADLPSLDRLLQSSSCAPLVQKYGHTRVTAQLRSHLARLRAQAVAGQLSMADVAGEAIIQSITVRLQADDRPALTPVFNLTGTVLHTNLGRAQLPDSVVQQLAGVLTEPVSLEFDLATGKRGQRDDAIEALICELTGAEAATVVNNNAAAVFLLLNTLGLGRDVVVSRGELVEIGGSFRIPDIMERAGARLAEVGTTNRTHLSDYENALTPSTALLLKVHCSNYEVVGFSKSVPLADVASLAHRHQLPAAVDLGSGTLVDFSRWGLPAEVTVQDSLAAGADIVTFSGDKLLGGPQAGFLVGQRELIAQINKNPLKRALRMGKLGLAALDGVLRLYRNPEQLADTLPTLRFLTRPVSSMQQQAQRLLPAVRQAVSGAGFAVQTAPMVSQIGSGSLPLDTLPSHGLLLTCPGTTRPGSHLQRLQGWLRDRPRPVIGRIADNAVWLDLRCLEERHEQLFVSQFHEPMP